MDHRVSHILNLLSRSVERQWTISEMAREVGLSVPRFHELFKKEIGSTPLTYLRKRRLQHVGELLRKDGEFRTIKEIAYSVGISDESHFTRDFKKEFGMTPTVFRNHSLRNRNHRQASLKCSEKQPINQSFRLLKGIEGEPRF